MAKNFKEALQFADRAGFTFIDFGGSVMRDYDIQFVIDRYDHFLIDLYHERSNPDYEENPDHRHGNDWLETKGRRESY